MIGLNGGIMKGGEGVSGKIVDGGEVIVVGYGWRRTNEMNLTSIELMIFC